MHTQCAGTQICAAFILVFYPCSVLEYIITMSSQLPYPTKVSFCFSFAFFLCLSLLPHLDAEDGFSHAHRQTLHFF